MSQMMYTAVSFVLKQLIIARSCLMKMINMRLTKVSNYDLLYDRNIVLLQIIINILKNKHYLYILMSKWNNISVK